MHESVQATSLVVYVLIHRIAIFMHKYPQTCSVNNVFSTGGAGAVGTFGVLHVTKALMSFHHAVVDAP